MAQVTSRFRALMGELRRQASFRTGDEHTILWGWLGFMEHHVNRLEKGLSETDAALAIEALRSGRNQAEGHLDDIRSSKAPPHVTAAEVDAARVRYAAIVEDQPWALPSLLHPKGQYGGVRKPKS